MTQFLWQDRHFFLLWSPSCFLHRSPSCVFSLVSILCVYNGRHFFFIFSFKLNLKMFYIGSHLGFHWSPSCLFTLVTILFVYIGPHLVCLHWSPSCLFTLVAIWGSNLQTFFISFFKILILFDLYSTIVFQIYFFICS